MAQKGQYKKPIEDSSKAFLRAISLTESLECDFALYMIAGRVRCIRGSSKSYKNRVDEFKNSLIGVYSQGIDVRFIQQDINAFYEVFK